MSLLEGLRFSRGDSAIHNLDPRIKFFMALVMFTAAVMFTHLTPMLILFFLQVPIILVGRIQKEWLKSLKSGLMFAVIIFATNILSFYFIQGRHLSTRNVEYALSLTARFIVLITSFSIFFLTTSPDKLSLALEKARVPFEFNFAFITAIRFVPVLADEAQSIIDAQRSRGLELDKGNLISRLKNYIPILLPLIINSIRRSLELAEAMESRAFGATTKRSNLYELKMNYKDFIVFIASFVALAFTAYIRFFMPPIPPIFPMEFIL